MIIDVSQFDPKELCPICLNEYGNNLAVFQTNCGHKFHNDCLQDYCRSQRGNVVCPVCRTNVGDACQKTIRQGGRRTRLRGQRQKKRTKRRHIKKRQTRRILLTTF